MGARREKPSDWLKEALEAHFSCKELSSRRSMTERALCRYFLVGFSLDLEKWMKKERYIKAVFLLAAGASVKTAAGLVGMDHASHLSRGFKGRFGVTPREFKRDLAKYLPQIFVGHKW